MRSLTALLLLLVLPAISLRGGNNDDTTFVRPLIHALRVSTAPKIDGVLDDAVWNDAEVAGNFIQYDPAENTPVSYPTEVRVLYDNTAIYLAAMCYDEHPDSIKQQLGKRDDYLNVDDFMVRFDTYNTQQDAFTFAVSASGVQRDFLVSDPNFNAVWNSAVKILSNGWSVEIAIPWSALRFPTSKIQEWGVQFARNIKRKFEYDQWAYTPKKYSNSMKRWGLLEGIDNVETPVRLSLTPYLTTIWEKDNRFGETKPSMDFSGGLNLKYGINESFTLDMTLLPDFSQVKSDDVVKNLSPFEIQYQEQRPFFTEGTDLFSLGDVFYSRRIGRTPTSFYDAPYLTNPNEVIIKNPNQSRLLNATKLSGRTNSGMGIGVLNAFVDNTYAVAQDTITGETRRILTEPSANYNIFVFDKQLKYSSHVYFTNTNVIRSHSARSADVSCSGFSLNNKKNTWNVNAVGGVSNVFTPTGNTGEFTSSVGYYYNAGVFRTSGKFQYGVSRQAVNKRWDCNDMGINLETNYSNNDLNLAYNIFDPWKIFNNAFFNVDLTYNENLITHDRNSITVSSFNMATFRNFWNCYLGTEITPVDSRDNYEPRVDGRYYMRTRYYSFFGGLNTNENKKVSFGISGHGGTTARISPTTPANPWGGAGLNVFWRVGDRFSLSTNASFHGDFGDRGWVEQENDGTIVFGQRTLRNWENSVSANFVFMKDMTISFVGRHYWETGHYYKYFVLEDNGYLTDYVNYTGDHDFSFNSVNVDVVYSWIFAPGSTLSVSYKQNVLKEDQTIDFDYFNNLGQTIRGPQLNQLSVRFLYYLDYNSIASRARKNTQ
ncbi:MAG TPA: DUF5916 domain-containing protein [Bacteroidia bacterium]|jgi:hypothetical protein|nr:DUF5916 domain-containing protein [Bacteroidia bacterium]